MLKQVQHDISCDFSFATQSRGESLGLKVELREGMNLILEIL